jgi:MFS family permease
MKPHGVAELLRAPGFVAYLPASALMRFSQSALLVLLGYHLYQLTHDPLSLGWLGLAQAGPAITLVLYGGHVADRHSRWLLTVLARCVYAALGLLLALAAWRLHGSLVPVIYLTAFGVGCSGAFSGPAIAGLEAEIVSRQHAMRAVSVLGAVNQMAALSGPVLGSVIFAAAGPWVTYALIGGMFALSTAVIALFVPNTPAAPRAAGDGALARIAEGIRAVRGDQLLIGSMALDLFAVFFGGAAAMLPIFATDILHVGAEGFGVMRAAISVGGFAAMMIAVRHPPRERAGLALLLAVAGFGVTVLVFAFSRLYLLSVVSLALMGACDGVSMVVRQGIMRLAVPGPLRGRVSAVRSVFLSSSNELGDFESGVLASALGAVPAVWIGGVITLGVVAATAVLAPKLRDLDIAALEREGSDHVAVAA